MKRYYTLLAAVLLGGCNLLQKDQPAPESIGSDIISSQESTTISESSSSSSVEPTVISLFDESISGDTHYPKVSAPLTFSQEELMTAITEYYQSNYSTVEKEANYSEIPADTLKEIQTYLQEDESIKDLNATVRQINFNLGKDKVYVAQVIVPMSFEKANQMLPENDFLLLNNVLAHLGNRLVMVAYYDDATHMLLPVHLTNNNNPLFYFSGE